MHSVRLKLVIDKYAKITYQKLEQIVNSLGAKVSDDYDFVIIVGGDGSLLSNAPSFTDSIILPIEGPKSPGYKSRGILVKHSFSELRSILKTLQNGTYKIREEPLLELSYMSKRYLSAGDFFVERCNSPSALRYRVKASSSSVKVDSYSISNGFIVSTPMGSTGYYSYIELISKKRPKRINGIGVAHILPTFVSDRVNGVAVHYEPRRVLPFDSIIEVKLERAVNAYLNMPGHASIPAKQSSVFKFALSSRRLRIIE
ncbi:MAG: hypothetical protein ACP5RM_03385 [Candidatus Micrarchaeia archaeon]